MYSLELGAVKPGQPDSKKCGMCYNQFFLAVENGSHESNMSFNYGRIKGDTQCICSAWEPITESGQITIIPKPELRGF